MIVHQDIHYMMISVKNVKITVKNAQLINQNVKNVSHQKFYIRINVLTNAQKVIMKMMVNARNVKKKTAKNVILQESVLNVFLQKK